MAGTLLRQIISGHTVKIGDALVPHAAFVSYPIADIHHDSEIYQDPGKWNPSRYLPEGSEHTKKPYVYIGWGAGRHPCRKFPSSYVHVVGLLTLGSRHVVCQSGVGADNGVLACYV